MVYPDYVFSSFFWCAVLPMFLALFAIAGIIVYRRDKEIQKLTNTADSLRNKIMSLELAKDKLEANLQSAEEDVARLSELFSQNTNMYGEWKDLETQFHDIKIAYGRLSNEFKQQSDEIFIYRKKYTDIYKKKWLLSIQKPTRYVNELEVEVKFVHHLIIALGFSNDDFSIRQKVSIKVGRNEQSGQADWVIWQKNKSGEKTKVLAVIEAKSSEQKLTKDVREQARSYAYALNATIYILTNGLTLKIYKRGIESDELLVDCEVGELSDSWSIIEDILLN